MTGFPVGALFFEFPLQFGMYVSLVWGYQGVIETNYELILQLKFRFYVAL